MQSNPAARSEGRRLAGRPIHARQPPTRHNLGFGDVLEVDDRENVVGETIKMRRNEGVASARPPQAVDAEALHFEKGNLLHLGRTGNVVNAQTRTESLTVGVAVGKLVL